MLFSCIASKTRGEKNVQTQKNVTKVERRTNVRKLLLHAATMSAAILELVCFLVHA